MVRAIPWVALAAAAAVVVLAPEALASADSPLAEVQCAKDMVLVSSTSGRPACVSERASEALKQRGWAQVGSGPIKAAHAQLPSVLFSDDFEGDLSSWVLAGEDNNLAITIPGMPPSGQSLDTRVLGATDCRKGCTLLLDHTLDTTAPVRITFDVLFGHFVE